MAKSRTQIRVEHADYLLAEATASPSSTMVEAAVAGAQVHATLALVEQQRVANHIRWLCLQIDADGDLDTDLARLPGRYRALVRQIEQELS